MSWQDRILKPDTSVEQMKQKAALRALEHVRDGMKLGLGTGSTAQYFVDGLGAQIAEGMLDVTCVPTSETTRQQAEGLGIKLASLDDLKNKFIENINHRYMCSHKITVRNIQFTKFSRD